jgi:allene oxide cyclase-like protein
MKRLAPPALVALVAGGLLAAPAPAQAPATRTITLTELDKGSTFAYVDNPPRSKRRGEPSASLGDAIVFTNPLVDAAGTRVGRLYAHCTVVVAKPRVEKATFLCTLTLTLADGTLAVQGLVNPSVPTTTAAVIGGTGAYDGARGTAVSTQKPNGDSADTITLLG